MKKYIAVAVLIVSAMVGWAVAQACTYGTHTVCPPPYWDQSGNRVIPACYEVCNVR